MPTFVGRVCVAGSFIVASVLVAGVAAQTPPDQKTVPKLKTVSAVPIRSVEGVDNFAVYCAACHGPDAKGNGPAAPAMKVPVPDLTKIAMRNKGKFDAIAVELIVKGSGKTSTPAHGVETMPIWGDVFRDEEKGVSTLRIRNLVRYLEFIQQK